jgi:hypothetical protein
MAAEEDSEESKLLSTITQTTSSGGATALCAAQRSRMIWGFISVWGLNE